MPGVFCPPPLYAKSSERSFGASSSGLEGGESSYACLLSVGFSLGVLTENFVGL